MPVAHSPERHATSLTVASGLLNGRFQIGVVPTKRGEGVFQLHLASRNLEVIPLLLGLNNQNSPWERKRVVCVLLSLGLFEDNIILRPAEAFKEQAVDQFEPGRGLVF